MTEKRLKCIALFIMESLFIQNSNKIDDVFAHLFNNFIEKCYQEENELLRILYDNEELVKEFIDEKYPFLTSDQMYQLLIRYGGFKNYIKLIDEIGYETDSKINELVAQFANYQNNYFSELEKLYNADPKEFYPKGFSKILQ